MPPSTQEGCCSLPFPYSSPLRWVDSGPCILVVRSGHQVSLGLSGKLSLSVNFLLEKTGLCILVGKGSPVQMHA